MAAKQYQYRMTTDFDNEAPGLTIGVIPDTEKNWITEDVGTVHTSKTYLYYYHDANRSGAGGVWSDANSTRVAVSVSQSWTTKTDAKNNLIVDVETTIESIVRDQAQGSNSDTPGRIISLYDATGKEVLSLTDYQVATNHTIYSGPKTLDPAPFTIPPGEDKAESSLYLHNQTVGYSSYDNIWMGVQFKNILPKDYRPGCVLDGNRWLSHNRDGGKCHILSGNSWKECRTVGGDENLMGNPPSIYHDGKWYNQHKRGYGG